MTGEVAWGVIWMVAILLVLVTIAIYYIFMYDTWYPNDGTKHGDQDSSLGSQGRSHDGSYEGTHS